MSRRSPSAVPSQSVAPWRRTAAALLALAVGVGAFGLSVAPAYAVPDAPTITTPAATLNTVGPTVEIAGTLAAPSGYDYLRVLWSAGGTVVEECWQSFGPGDTVFSCTSAVPPPGVYTVVAQHSDVAEPGESDWSAPSNAVTVIVGSETPVTITNYMEIENTFPTRTPTLEGVGPALGSISVEIIYGGEGSATYCTVAEVSVLGTWSCTGSPDGPWGYGSTAFRADGFDVTGNPTLPDSGDFISGDMVPPPPSTTITVGPASVSLVANGVELSYVTSELYSVAVFEGDEYVYGEPDASCSPSDNPSFLECSFDGLAPGIWNFYTLQDFSEIYQATADDYILIPETPGSFDADVNSDRTVTFSGTGAPGFTVSVRGSGGNDVCSATVGAGSAWQCTASLAAGTAGYRAIQQSVDFGATPPESFGTISSYNGMSAYTGVVSVTVPAAPVAPRTAPTPLPTLTPLPWTLEGYDGGPLTPGQQLSLSATGLPAGTTVVVEIRSTPRVLGTTVVNDAGAFALDVTVPADLEPGAHTLVAIATPPGGIQSPVAIPVSVLAAPVPEPVKEGAGAALQDKAALAATGNGGSTGAAVDRSDPASPSAISDSIPTIDRIVRTPLFLVAAGGLALAILLLVAFPAELLNSTLASNTRRLGRWYAAVERGVERATEWFAAVTRTRALAAAVLVVLTALIFGFVDPDYGFDPVSLRMTVSLAIGLFIVTYVASWISGAIIERVWDIPTRVSLQPAALVFAVLGVIVARLLEFSPGFLIGLVIGLDLLTRVGAPHRVRATLTNIGVIVGLALVGWVVFSIMAAVATGEPTVVSLLVSDALVATTSEGLTAALAALMPLGFLQGHELFRASKLLWAGTFATVATLFALIVLPTASGDDLEVANVGFWMLIMVIFAAVTLTLWAVLQFAGRGEADDDEVVEQPVGASR